MTFYHKMPSSDESFRSAIYFDGFSVFFFVCLLHFGCRGGVFVFLYIRLCVTGFVFLFVTLFVCLLFARRSG